MSAEDAQPDGLQIRPAEEADVSLILEFIRGIAEYEKLSHEVEATEESLRESLFGEKPCAETLLAFLDHRPAGYAVYFHNFSTFAGRRGLYLEDLFVKPEFRGQGVGKRLLLRLAVIARERNCGRFEWVALDWNESAIEFYKSLGAKMLPEWNLLRLDGKGIEQLAGRD